MTGEHEQDSEETRTEPAATVLLLRDGGAGLEVFMIARRQEVSTFSGALVFPGGKVDVGDHAPELRALAPGAESLDTDTLALRVAAIREAFEECGVLLARSQGDGVVIGQERLDEITANWQRRIATDEAGMLELCRAERLELAVDALVPFAHWITPPIVPRIYDTHFFLAAAPADHVAPPDGHEGEDSVWIAPGEAEAEAAAGTRTVVFPTRMNLIKLARASSVAEALARARAAEVVTVQPRVSRHERGRVLAIPEAANYGATRFLVGPGGVGVEVLG
ncbi:MAG: NUDIX domain-containing protein [Alphaproteobacteria bacterium]|nr:NUDIX domain-containing protein [Alphaproteobacteria bacterium]